MNWGVVLGQSAVMGLVLSTVLTVLIIISLKINPEIWYNDYPEEVRKVYGPMSEKGKRLRILFVIPIFGAMIAAMIIMVIRLGEALGSTPAFMEVFAGASVIFLIFSLVDAFIIDWLILMVLWPDLGVLPGTRGMAFYHDMRAWAFNLLKSMPISLIVGLLTAGITSLVMWVGSLV